MVWSCNVLSVFDEYRERRRRTRFPISFGIHYIVDGPQKATSGIGQVLNISSQGVLIKADQELLPGTLVKLAIDWPVRLDSRCSLALHVGGRVVRSGRGETAVVFCSRELRTQPLRPLV